VNGLVNVPDARMAPDATLRTSYARQSVVDIFALGYQATPWLQTTFRYSIFDPRDAPGSRDELNDRSFELKARLLREGDVVPQVAVGIRDLVGTGVWGAEYVVASKRVGPLDLSLGLGWGRLAERRVAENPLARIDEGFEERDADVGRGGEFSFSNFFAGEDVGAFGGVRWTLPRLGASLLAEYDSDALSREAALGSIDDPSPWSFGLEFEPARDVQVGLSWQHGEELGLRVSAQLRTDREVAPKAPNGFRRADRNEDRAPRIGLRGRDWYLRMVSAAEASGLLVHRGEFLDPTTLHLVYANRDYQYEADAIRRLLVLAEAYAPKETRVVVVTGSDGPHRTHAVRHELVRRAPWAGELAPETLARPPVPVPVPGLRRRGAGFDDGRVHVTPYRYPNVALFTDLGLRAYIFDPDHPLLYQLFARFTAEADLGRGFGVTASWMQNLYDQFDRIERGSDSVLPRVRSDLPRYLKEGPTGVDRLALTHDGMLARDLHYRAFAGILEEMYAGAGAEVLYRPWGRSVALGANLIAVRQRDFDRSFGLRDYETVIGHLSAYWATPWQDFDIAVHAGRYLARDWGATLEVQRRFANGWSVGAFATLTDVPFDEFGEGSFDKGLVLRIPFNSFTQRNTRGAYRTVIRSIQRDGGQRLAGWGTELWERLRGSHRDQLVPYRGRMRP
jgi:hypothetical protein